MIRLAERRADGGPASLLTRRRGPVHRRWSRDDCRPPQLAYPAVLLPPSRDSLSFDDQNWTLGIPNNSARVSQLQFVAALSAIFFMTMVAASGVALSQGTTTTPAQQSEPKVIMEADPLPPFTYWAPENSTIRNHPRLPGVWITETADGPRIYYFGDRCRASEFQGFIGKQLDALPERPADATWRMTCSICAVTSNLGRERMNVFYDDDSREIISISCE